MKKQFFRVKQIADQTFLRAEKTDVLTEDLVNAEKRVDTIRASCQITQKKIASCQIDLGSETSTEKRLKKLPQIGLASSMLENGNSFTKNSVLGDTLRECAAVQTKLGNELLEYYNDVEKSVLKPISGVLDNEIHNINKLRKQLGKLVLDMDSARTRFQTAEKHSLQTSAGVNINSMGKVDTLKDELEEASQKVDQCRDALASEMFSLIGKEPQLANSLVHFHQLLANYHRHSLAALESILPSLETHIANFAQKPVYGCMLEDHLRVTHRQIAEVIETCVLFLLEYGVPEEGLLRIAGSASKLKKLKSAFDAGVEMDDMEYVRDPHAVAGALKSYLRELPEPLMTFSLYEEWMAAAKIPDFDGRLQALWQVLHKLPDTHFHNLQFVIKFLSKVHEKADVNKMSSQNIAIVMAPNLMWAPFEEPNSTFGMNMSTASLHTAIVDSLISYVDWFFPDAEIPTLKKELSSSDLNENTIPSTNNGSSSCSPRALHKTTKKPAAPPPPAQKFIDCDKKADLILMSEPVPSKESLPILRRKSNENLCDSVIVPKSEKPLIPDKPTTYSSYSLDRRSQRPASTCKSDKIVEGMSRSQVERPSVPPPERPNKPSKFHSSENLTAADLKNTQRNSSTDDEKLVEGSTETLDKCDNSPTPLKRSRSATKVNRFDFLVNQGAEKPPERPPRCGETVAQEECVPPPVSPRSLDLEKTKPPRPQPPVPAKPKLNSANEDTAL